MTDFFRREALEYAARRLPGEVVLWTPLSSRLLAALMVGLVVAFLAFASVASFARRERVQGWLTPEAGMIRLVAQRPGMVDGLHVTEGQLVARATPVASLRLSGDTAAGDTGLAVQSRLAAEAAAADRRAAAEQSRLLNERGSLAERIAIITTQRQVAGHRTQLLSERLAVARAAVSRAEPLVASGYVSKTYMDNLRTAAISAEDALASVRLEASNLDRQLSEARQRLQAIPTDIAVQEAAAAGDRAALDQRRIAAESQAQAVLRSPLAARVLALPLLRGQPVAGGTTVAMLMPRGSGLVAELYVPSRAAGFIRRGQEVRLMYQAFPFRTFGTARGVVQSVSGTVVAPGDVQIPGLEVKEPVFRVLVGGLPQTVSAYGRAVPLQPGMLLDADIVLERRSLLQWILDPLYAAGRAI